MDDKECLSFFEKAFAQPLEAEAAATPLRDLPPIELQAGKDLHVGHFEAAELRRLLAESARRRLDGLKLYEPLPKQLAFHASTAAERVFRGANRTGKTVAAAVETARALLGCDPFHKYPKENGRCVCVGKDGRHIGQVMWRKLWRAGAFKIIRDANTGVWRAYRPHEAADLARIEECKFAPPLIPGRMIKQVAWENKKEEHPNVVRLVNGWEVAFFSSLGKPPQGLDVDLVWFDEEVVDPRWYTEMSARLLDRRGKFIWSATPQAGTEQLYSLHEEAQRECPPEKKRVAEFVVRLDDNPHISEEAKRDFIAKISEDEYQVRVEGEFAVAAYRVFPEFQKSKHMTPWFKIPFNWTRYASVDPGRQVCAVLFAAVPPPGEQDRIYFYDELYITNSDAELFGQKMHDKCEGQVIQAFLIDRHGGRLRDIGSGRSIEDQYRDALRRHGVASVATGPGFFPAPPDVLAGLEAFRMWLRGADEKEPRLRVLEDACPNFLWEISRYRYKRQNGVILDRPEDRGRVHQMANARYLAMFSPTWVPPGSKRAIVTGAVKVYRDKLKKRKDNGERGWVSLGPRKAN